MCGLSDYINQTFKEYRKHMKNYPSILRNMMFLPTTNVINDYVYYKIHNLKCEFCNYWGGYFNENFNIYRIAEYSRINKNKKILSEIGRCHEINICEYLSFYLDLINEIKEYFNDYDETTEFIKNSHFDDETKILLQNYILLPKTQNIKKYFLRLKKYNYQTNTKRKINCTSQDKFKKLKFIF